MANNESVNTDQVSDLEKDAKKKSKRLAQKLLKKEVSKPEKPAIDWLKPVSQKEADKDAEKDTEVEKLSEAEIAKINADLRLAAQKDRHFQASYDPEIAVHEALDEFDRRIIEDNQSPQDALWEVLSHYEIDEDIIDGLTEDDADQIIDDAFYDKAAFNVDKNDSEPLVIEQYESPMFDLHHDTSDVVNLDYSQPTEADASPTSSTTYTKKPNHSYLIQRSVDSLMDKRRKKLKSPKKAQKTETALKLQVNNLNNQLLQKERIIKHSVTRQAELATDLATSEFEAGSLKKVLYSKELTSRPPKISATEGKLGKFIIETDKPSAPKETKPKKSSIDLLANKKVETMDRDELIKLSDNIDVEGSTLKQIYDTHLIGENGLRRLVAEHQRGGNLNEALKQEITEREIDFERDPILRDMAKPSSSSTTSKSIDLTKLLEKAEASIDASNEEAAFYKAKADFEGKLMKSQSKNRHILDSFLIAAISLLALLVFLLYLIKK